MTAPKNRDATTRSIQLEVEVPGTPAQVWQAIATGPGITAWFVPAEVAEREGGALALHLFPGIDSSGVVTVWDPPRRFAYEERDWLAGAPPVATEFVIEARSGGTCVVRLVNSLFASSDDWDDQLKGFEKGWPPFLHILRLYLTHFPGQRCSTIRVVGSAAGPEERAWGDLTAALGLSGAAVGERRSAGPGVPRLTGVVERASDRPEMLLAVDDPAPGFALLGAFTWDDKVTASVSLYLFGADAHSVAARDEPEWRAWMETRFPSAG
jgi:uncharacterized protein YndB with AHSA1/START domain